MTTERDQFEAWCPEYIPGGIAKGSALEGWKARAAIAVKREAELLERVKELERVAARKDDALHRLDSWVRAYPTTVFHEPTNDEWARANEVLEQAGISMTAMSASNMRHVITKAGEIIAAAMKVQP